MSSPRESQAVRAGADRVRPWDHAIGAALAAVYVAVLVATARTQGYARDEGFYFDAARSYAGWFDLLFRDPRAALERGAIDQAWSVNHEHPSLMKSFFALSWRSLHERALVFAEAGTAFRFPAMVTAGLCLWLVYRMGVRAFSRRAGLFAALFLATIPQLFYHAHLDCFDVPVMFFWTLVVHCYWRSLEGSVRWALATAVAWGCALDVKFNVFLLPLVFVAHWIATRGRDLTTEVRRGGVSFPLAVPLMLTVGSGVFVALWPWMWFDTFVSANNQPGRLAEYLGFHWNHPYYNMEYFGYNYFRPKFPRSFVYVMTAITVPSVTLVAMCTGIGVRWRAIARDLSGWIPRASFREARATDDPRGTDVLFLGAGYAILALWWKSDTPIFGGTKHWITLLPFLALYAGVGLDACCDAMAAYFPTRPRLAIALTAATSVLPGLVETAHAHPYGISAYTDLAGGFPGGADLGMNRQFWGYTTGSLAGYLNGNVREGGTVFIHDTAWAAWAMLQEDGRVRRDIRVVWSPAEADFALVHHELHMNEVDYQIWQAYQSPAVDYVLAKDGVPFVSVYRNPHRAR